MRPEKISQHMQVFLWTEHCKPSIDHFRYIKIHRDSEAKRTEKKKLNKLGHSISSVVFPKPSRVLVCRKQSIDIEYFLD